MWNCNTDVFTKEKLFCGKRFAVSGKEMRLLLKFLFLLKVSIKYCNHSFTTLFCI